jgi:hypothetical protein
VKPDGPVFDRVWKQECSVEPATKGEVDWMIKRHYIGKWPGVCVAILALKHLGKPVGVLVFALPPRETNKRYGGVTWELARLWIDDSIPANSETFLISKGVKWVHQNRPEVEVLVSYADPSAGHNGTIYKAANWVSDGRTDEGRKTPRCDYACTATGKKYSRKGHVPPGVDIVRVPRVSKPRFIYRVRK